MIKNLAIDQFAMNSKSRGKVYLSVTSTSFLYRSCFHISFVMIMSRPFRRRFYWCGAERLILEVSRMRIGDGDLPVLVA